MSGVAAMRRTRSIGRAELLLFWRNRTALFNALLVPVLIMGAVAGATMDSDAARDGELRGNALLTTGMLGFVLISVVYYNLVTTYVARREELVLKRLRVGEVTDLEILAGTASPAIAIAAAQIVLFVVAGAALLGLPVPVNAPVLILGAMGGVGVFVILAVASSAFTRTVELAQITTLPVLVVCMLGSGLVVPLELLPGPAADIVRLLPLTPAVELMRLGWLGTTGEGVPRDFVGVLGAATAPAMTLALWAALGVAAVRRWFRWEPRR
ncbi:ABC transporter permease [Actinoplanes sp. ATCC 53533]|uniref:ABC transporter permease n=1 Tax=Actinoplanes sp. ATCC 53533 TaxID=1288362 RepID=UPI001F447753|nr:ABC transporter permease [Actinoplanes sp. ATCC 53533]